MKKSDLQIIKHIGKGKSGNSYLAKFENMYFVLKELHDEEVSYYKFHKSKIEHELEAYNVLSQLDIAIPKLIDYSLEEKYIIKEYVPGQTASEVIADGKLNDSIILDMLTIENKCKAMNINLDYFPSNFVINGNEIFYIDYEYNNYTDEWNYRNWGIYYWLNPDGFKQFLISGNADFINEKGTGIPVKNNYLINKRNALINDYESTKKA